MRKSITLRLTLIAMFIAVNVVFNVCSVDAAQYLKISFVYMPCIIAGLLFGPIGGFAVGFLGDFLGSLIFLSGGPYNVLIGISCGLLGLIPGLVRYLPVKDFWKIIISSTICLIVCTAFLSTFALWLMFAASRKTFWAYLIVRIPGQSLVAALNCALIITVYPLLKRAMGKAGLRMGATKKPVLDSGDSGKISGADKV